MNPTIIIQFDPETWKPIAVFPNGCSNEETAKLCEIADKMLAKLEGNNIDKH